MNNCDFCLEPALPESLEIKPASIRKGRVVRAPQRVNVCSFHRERFTKELRKKALEKAARRRATT